eukprot:s5293_g2.t2
MWFNSLRFNWFPDLLTVPAMPAKRKQLDREEAYAELSGRRETRAREATRLKGDQFSDFIAKSMRNRKVDLPAENNKTAAIYILNVFMLWEYLATRCQQFAEVTPGNVLKPESATKAHFFYVGAKQMGQLLFNESCWFLVAVVRSVELKTISGKLAAVTAAVCRHLSSLRLGHLLKIAGRSTMLLGAVRYLLADTPALAFSFGAKTFAGRKICFKCANILATWVVLGPREKRFGFRHASAPWSECQPLSDREIFEIVEILHAQAAHSSKSQMQTLEVNLGYNHNPFLFLVDGWRGPIYAAAVEDFFKKTFSTASDRKTFSFTTVFAAGYFGAETWKAAAEFFANAATHLAAMPVLQWIVRYMIVPTCRSNDDAAFCRCFLLLAEICAEMKHRLLKQKMTEQRGPLGNLAVLYNANCVQLREMKSQKSFLKSFRVSRTVVQGPYGKISLQKPLWFPTSNKAGIVESFQDSDGGLTAIVRQASLTSTGVDAPGILAFEVCDARQKVALDEGGFLHVGVDAPGILAFEVCDARQKVPLRVLRRPWRGPVAEASVAQVEVDACRREGYGRVTITGGWWQSLAAYQCLIKLFSTLDTSAEPARDAVRIWRSKALDQKKSSVGKLLTANLCMISPGACVKLSVVLGLGGLAIAVILLVTQSWLKIPYPGSICFLLYFLIGMRVCCVLLGTMRVVSGGVLLTLVGAGVVKTIGTSILGAMSGLGFLYIAMIPIGQLLTSVIRRVAPQVVHDAQEKRMQQFLPLLPGYDIVCLQELTVAWGQDDWVTALKDFAKSAGLRHFASSGKWPQFPAFFAAAGLVILSKYNIKRSELLTFSRQSWFEWSAVQRGALMVELEGPKNKKIAVINVHTTAGLEVVRTGMHLSKQVSQGNAKVNPTGLKQLEEALRRFEEFSKGCDQRIFCGDFNLSKDSDSLQSFFEQAKEKLKLVDQYADCPPTFGCVDEHGKPRETLLTKHTKNCRPRCIDHVLSDVKCKAARVDNMTAKPEDAAKYGYQQVSDHSAVEIEWT